MGLDYDDGWVWQGSKLGVYSIASGYNWLFQEHIELRTADDESWLWKVKVLEKIKLLFCLVFNNAILIDEFRFVRNL